MKLAKIFSKGVVLQRNKPTNIFGTGKGSVEVTFGNNTVSGEFFGEDGFYHTANYEIADNELVVYSDNVSNPIAVKYAFCNWTMGGLINSSGFPASPFRMGIDI